MDDVVVVIRKPTEAPHMRSTLATLAFLFLVALPASSSDGVIEINQICAVQSGCLAMDAPGFPVTIGSSGSYLLTSDLSISDPDLGGIEITVDAVTLDLGGFLIEGPVACSNAPNVTCSPSGSGVGIEGQTQRRITVMNGRVSGFADRGVSVGQRSQIVRVNAESNGDDGISTNRRSLVTDSSAHTNAGNGIRAGIGSTIQDSVSSANKQSGFFVSAGGSILDCTAYENGGIGIETAVGCVVRNTTAYRNRGDGFSVESGCLLSDNASMRNEGDGIQAVGATSIQRNVLEANDGVGLRLDPPSAYRGNVVHGNSGGTVTAGVDAGGNVCSGTTGCP